MVRNTQIYTAANSDEFDAAEIPSIPICHPIPLALPLASEDPIELPVKVHAVTGAGLIGERM